MTTVISTQRDDQDHAYPRQYPTQGTTYHQRASLAATPDADESTREQAFAAGADPAPDAALSAVHDASSCAKCALTGPVYDQAAARGRPEHQQVVTSRLIEGPE